MQNHPRSLPRWADFPDLDLYMDQVLGLMDRWLGACADGKALTSSMVNNYVKLGIMPAPVKKKYNREHLAYLIIICVLKPILPIASIHQLMDFELESVSLPQLYDRFCGHFDTIEAAVAEAKTQPESTVDAVYHAALRAQAEQALAVRLLESILPSPPEKPEKTKPNTKSAG